jgi:hypothetical protein
MTPGPAGLEASFQRVVYLYMCRAIRDAVEGLADALTL